MLCVHVKHLLQAARLFHRFWNRSSSNSRTDKNFHEFYIWCSFAIYSFYFCKWNIPLFILYWFSFYHIPNLSHVLCKVFDYDVVFSQVLKRAKPRIERDLCSLWGFLRVRTGHCSMNVIESRVSVWCLLYQIFPTRFYSLFPIRLLNNMIWKERCRWHVYFSHSTNAVRYFAFLCKVTWTQLYKMFVPAPIQYCHTSLAPSQNREVSFCSYKLYVPCFAQPLLSTVTLHWLACRFV